MFRKSQLTGVLLLILFSVLFTGCFGSVTPTYTLEGVKDDETYDRPVKPIVTPGEDTTVTLLLNGEPFDSGTEITADGEYKLTIKAKAKKKEVVDIIEFTIETGAPEFKVGGVEDGKYYSEAVTPKITIGEDDDRTDIEVTVTLNGNKYTEGTPIEADGEYTLVVNAKKGDKTRTVTIKFEIGEALGLAFIGNDLSGFSTDKADDLEYITNQTYIKEGEASIKINTQIDKTSALRINRKLHPSWPSDWSEYKYFVTWVYIEDVSVLQDNAASFKLYIPHPAAIETGWSADEFVDGWNFLKVDLAEIAGDNYDELKNMGGTNNKFLDLIIRTDEVATVYFSGIKLLY